MPIGTQSRENQHFSLNVFHLCCTVWVTFAPGEGYTFQSIAQCFLATSGAGRPSPASSFTSCWQECGLVQKGRDQGIEQTEYMTRTKDIQNIKGLSWCKEDAWATSKSGAHGVDAGLTVDAA
eukprot:5062365-Amphidinium_carterae.1